MRTVNTSRIIVRLHRLRWIIIAAASLLQTQAALIMAAFVGIVSGIYPAIRASKLNPVQALRYE